MSPGVLTVKRKGERTRVMLFQDHQDAIEVLDRFLRAGYECRLELCEMYGPGERPGDLPLVQEPLFEFG